MKLVDLNCPGCGAALKVNSELSKGVCNYCGREFLIDDEIKKLNITNGVQLGYQQEQGRIDAINNRRNELLNNLSASIEPAKIIADAYRSYQESEKKYRCYKTEPSIGGVVTAVLLNIFVAPIFALIFAAIIGSNLSIIPFWLILIIATVLIFVASHSGKVNRKQTLANQCNLAYEQYQNTLKLHYGKLAFLPPDYRYEEAIQCFYKYVKNSRANDIQQAMNLYEEEMHRLRIENAQLAMLREQQRQSSIQSAQLATQIGILISR